MNSRKRGSHEKDHVTAGIAVVVTAAIAATTKCRYCGSSSYGRGCSNGVHVHIDTNEHCEYCGSSSYGRGCSYEPRGYHRHGHGGNKCIWCGSTSTGKGCSYAPNGVHEK